MNNKELQVELSKRMSITQKESSVLMDSFVSELIAQLEEHEQVSFLGLGTLEVRKKEQRILVNPSSKQRMLIPPKLVLTFKQNGRAHV